MWTESFLKKVKINKKLYHFSDKKIEKWEQKTTCFFDAKDRSYGYIYEFEFDNEIAADYYQSDEYRINLKDKKYSVKLIGIREYLGRGKVREEWY